MIIRAVPAVTVDNSSPAAQRRPRGLWWQLLLGGRLPGQSWPTLADSQPAGVGATAGRRRSTEEVPGG